MNDCSAVSLKGVKSESSSFSFSPFWKSIVLMNRDLALKNFGFFGLYFLLSTTWGSLAFHLKSMLHFCFVLLLLASSYVLALCYLISTIAIISSRPVLSSFAFSSIIFLKRLLCGELKSFYLRQAAGHHRPTVETTTYQFSLAASSVYSSSCKYAIMFSTTIQSYPCLLAWSTS